MPVQPCRQSVAADAYFLCRHGLQQPCLAVAATGLPCLHGSLHLPHHFGQQRSLRVTRSCVRRRQAGGPLATGLLFHLGSILFGSQHTLGCRADKVEAKAVHQIEDEEIDGKGHREHPRPCAEDGQGNHQCQQHQSDDAQLHPAQHAVALAVVVVVQCVAHGHDARRVSPSVVALHQHVHHGSRLLGHSQLRRVAQQGLAVGQCSHAERSHSHCPCRRTRPSVGQAQVAAPLQQQHRTRK